MKDKKKVGLVKRIAAGVCAVMVVVGCMGTVPYYAASYPDISTADYWCCDNCPYIIFSYNGEIYMRQAKSIFINSSYAEKYGYKCGIAYSYDSTHKSRGFYITDDFTWYHNSTSAYSSDSVMLADKVAETDEENAVIDVLYVSCDVYDSYGNLVYEKGDQRNEGVYNSSLGYIQDLKRQFLYLEDDAWALVEDTAASKFTFSDTTSTGLNITDGNWSVRHYMQIEIKKFIQRKDGLVDTEIIQTYDTIYMNEYPAADLKVMYPQKDTLLKLHDESGFDGLSWWESNFLGYITYYNDYFQLVRTNEDGSVEYGGYVKLWQDDKNINYSVTLDENFEEDSGGYVDNVVPGTHGSGGTYEDAEHDADENASNSSNAGSDMMGQVNDILSTVMAVPEIFARMFSFLPDWCLTFFGISVALAGAVLLWKTIS